MSDHRPLHLLCILLNFIIVLASLVVVASSLTKQYGVEQEIPGLLDNDLQDIAVSKPSPISPASWIHNFWAVVFLWNFSWSFYSLTTLCRSSSDTDMPVYTSPVLLSPYVLLIFDLAIASNMAWFILYDRDYTVISSAPILGAVVFGWTSYAVSLHVMDPSELAIGKERVTCETRFSKFFIQNGLAMYAMWCVFVFAFNLAVSLLHNAETDMNTNLATVIALSVMASAQILFFVLDAIFLDRFARYTVSPYLISIVVLIACLYRQEVWKTDDVNFIFLCALAIFSFLAVMAKSACVAFREMKTSGYGDITQAKADPRHMDSIDESHYMLK